MKAITICLLTIIPCHSFAVEFYTIQGSGSSMRQLAEDCGKDEQDAINKLKEISDRLAPGQESPLTVTGYYGQTRSSSNPRSPASYEGYCFLDFKSNDSKLTYKISSPIMYTRISRANWESACKPEYEKALVNPNSPFTMLWLAWTLFQGRVCQVTTIEVNKAL